MADIHDLRKKINDIDKDMAKLFEERMKVVKEVAEYKKANSMPITDSNREDEIVSKNSSLFTDEDTKSYYVNFIKDTMKISKKYQEKIIEGEKVAYSGVEGAYAYLAAKKMFPNANLISTSSFRKAYQSVENGINEKAVLPIENSFAGDIGEVMDLMFFGSLYVNEVYDFSIEHCLLAKDGVKLENIKTVISHPQALMQCSDFIDEYNLKTLEEVNTAVAAKRLNDNETAVIASKDAASVFGLKVLKEKINNDDSNTTRFASFSRVLSHFENYDVSKKNFIIVFTVKNEAGALAKCLDIIGAHNFNMRNLCSRPVKNLMWRYFFYCDIEGDMDSPDAKDMFVALKVFCDRLKIVGTYIS